MAKLPSPNKDLGQHFLKDQKVITTITQNYHDQCDCIVEVGPGPAILSKHLALHKKPYFVIEMDDRFQEQLAIHIPTDHIFFEDAVKFDWQNFISKHNLHNKKIWLVSNLPYNVSSLLFISFVQIPQIHFMTLMFQKEVGEKTFWRDHEKNQMSSLLAISLNYFKSSQLLKVYPGAFHPPPKVDSVVVSYERQLAPTVAVENFKEFEKFLRELFKERRKQIGSVLKTIVTADKKDEFFTHARVENTLRAEALTLNQVYNLYNAYQSMK
jgi:16S rRNA (adenine1518-N6/adenine1519-N6)-dimethyltransferase